MRPGTPLVSRALLFAAIFLAGLGCSSSDKKDGAQDPKAVAELMEKMAAAREAGSIIGEYTSSLPATDTSSPGRDIRLRLAIEGTAEMTIDHLNGNPPVVRKGRWEALSPDKARVTFTGSNGRPGESSPAGESSLTLQRQGFSLIALEYDRSEWGPRGLRLLSTQAPAPHVSGTVTYRERVALTPTSSVEVVLEENSGEEILGRQIIPGPGQVPIPFELRYDPDRINPNDIYVVRARISDGGRVLFTTIEPTRVLTQGNPSQVEILLNASKGS